MKIANIELTKERIIMLAAAGAAILVLLVYLVVYAPLIRQLKKKHAECKATESETLYACHIVESAGKAGGVRMLIAEKDVSLAINELTNYGKDIGVNFVSILPKDIVRGKDARYNVLPIEMEIEAPDERFSAFLGSLDELEKVLIK
ncbi:MAG: hypothetical protein Q8N91_07390, partial [Candidatus Omnitrophota bacterium]|nr:hypothetical protein [Candidatus Omnitrophota bacterium]